ncbi:MAG: hypothetical protein DRQ64_08255, partial [Gammaproteobacteria bacterium]
MNRQEAPWKNKLIAIMKTSICRTGLIAFSFVGVIMLGLWLAEFIGLLDFIDRVGTHAEGIAGFI